MTNFQVYKKTLSFSLVQFLVDLAILVAVAGFATAGFFIFNSFNDLAIVGLIIGVIIGIVFASLMSVFVTNRIKAAQITMMTKGVTEGELPEKTFGEGFKVIKGRFGKITVFYFITNSIKSIFRQIGRAINRIGTAVGGDVGNGVTSAIDTAVQILIGYLCDCCLGWIMFRNDENPFKAGCEGCVIFFKHGKTLIRNVGRIFGMGIVSLIVIGGSFFGISYLIFSNFPNMFVALQQEISESAARNGTTLPGFFSEPIYVMLMVCAIVGVIMFYIIHGVLVRPFILTGVLRNFMEAGKEHLPTEAEFQELDSKFPKFAKLHNNI